MLDWVLILTTIGIIAFFLLLRLRRPSAHLRNKPIATEKKKYSGLAFVAEAHCCDAANTHNERRFLTSEAPNIPLAECSDPALCHCKYRNIDDRRIRHDRRHIVGALSKDMPVGDQRSNRRIGSDRRKDNISFD
ncbi:MAG: hypothetical protein P8M26_09125 [Gammaproteobacteria bacterium]|nr:hypothetical protein [Gammaproteobacteria bacterium]